VRINAGQRGRLKINQNDNSDATTTLQSLDVAENWQLDHVSFILVFVIFSTHQFLTIGTILLDRPFVLITQ